MLTSCPKCVSHEYKFEGDPKHDIETSTSSRSLHVKSKPSEARMQ